MASAGGAAARRRRLASGPLSVGAHLALLLAVVMARPETPATRDPEPMSVQLVAAPPPPAPEPAPVPEDRPDAPPPGPVASPAAAKPAAAKPISRTEAVTRERPATRPLKTRPAPPSPDVAPVALAASAATDGVGMLSDGEIAGAAVAGAGAGGGGGSGAGGGSCDMLRRLQDALRRDRRVQSAVAEAHRGRPLLVWNGDWVRHGVQEGDGLAAVREAIAWEVGFAPQACRTQAMRGLVLISLSDQPGASRLALGSAAWRWSDLVRSRSRQLQR